MAMRIQADGVEVGYGQASVLRGASLTVGAGEFVGLVGPNGSGKSTLLKAITRALPMRAGAVHLDGADLRRMSPRDVARQVAFVPQSEPTLFEFTVHEIVLMGRHPHLAGVRRETGVDLEIAARAMAAADILHLASRPITELSGGEHRRVLIARALAQEAPIMILDEPTAHLDISHQIEILARLRALADERSIAILAALHDLNLAAEFCTRIALLADGKIQASGAPETVMGAEQIEAVYGARVRVGRNPATGKPFLMPAPAPSGDATGARVHVFCGGGSGVAVMAELKRRGHLVTTGVLNRLDTDEDAATALGIDHVIEAPFSRIEPRARAECAALVERANVIVIAEAPIGHGNLANLEVALEAARAGKPVLLMGGGRPEERDFADGQGAAALRSIVAAGAVQGLSLCGLDTAIRTHLTGPPTGPPGP